VGKSVALPTSNKLFTLALSSKRRGKTPLPAKEKGRLRV
jgi:hypothetical protein